MASCDAYLLDKALTGATPTKTQRAIDAVFGDHGSWRAACVFASEDLDMFTRATDAERKRQLETLLQFDALDVALASCRGDLSSVQVTELNAARLEQAWRVGQVEQVEKRAAAARDRVRRLIAGVPAREGPSHADLRAEADAISAQIAEAEAALGRVDAEHEEAVCARPGEHPFAARVDKISAGKCPMCEQQVAAEFVADIRGQVDVARKRRQVADKRISALASERARLREVVKAVRRRAEAVELAIREAAQAEAAAAAHDDMLRRAREEERVVMDDLATVESARSEQAAAIGALERRARFLKVAEHVLGTRGVRAHVLDQALADVERIANVWASRIGDVELKLSSTTPKKSRKGENAATISLLVRHGRMGWRPFHALSSGQRRRVDVALLFAFSEVACAVRGVRPGTIFCDEVDVNLDAAGVAALADVLQEMSADRCVVVISPDGRVGGFLEPTSRLHVHDGVIHRC
jgi:DNA repair exonuclease SbcCD ATPase subunit